MQSMLIKRIQDAVMFVFSQKFNTDFGPIFYVQTILYNKLGVKRSNQMPRSKDPKDETQSWICREGRISSSQVVVRAVHHVINYITMIRDRLLGVRAMILSVSWFGPVRDQFPFLFCYFLHNVRPARISPEPESRVHYLRRLH